MRTARTLLVAGLTLAAGAAVGWLLTHMGDEPVGVGGDGGNGSGTAAPGEAESAGGDAAAMSAAGPGPSLAGTSRKREEEPEQPAAVAGTVVDEERRRVAGASVTLRVPGLPETKATTDANGRFRVAATLPESEGVAPAGGLYAEDGRGRSGVERVRFVKADSAATADGPTVEIRPSASLDVRVVEGGEGGAIGGARVLAWAAPEGRLAETGVKVADAWAGADGLVRLPALPAGPVALLAIAPDGRRSRSSEVLAGKNAASTTIEIEPGTGFRVRVVGMADRRPLAGVRIQAFREGGAADDPAEPGVAFDPPVEIPATDAEGLAWVKGLPPGDLVAFLLTTPGGTRSWASEGRAGGGEVLLELGQPQTVRWPLSTGASPPPPDGTTIVVRGGPSVPGKTALPDDLLARVEGRHVVLDGWPLRSMRAFAWTPDGRVARLRIEEGETTGEPASFSAPRRVEVRAAEDGGAPAAGISLELEAGPESASEPGVTDADGHVTLVTPWSTSSPGSPIEVAMIVGGTDAETVGTWEPAAPSAAAGAGAGTAPTVEVVRVTVPRRREVGVRVLVAGAARLPAGLRWEGSDTLELRVEEDGARGVLKVTYRAAPGEEARPEIRLAAPGFRRAKAPLPTGGAPGPASLDVALERSVALVLRSNAPKGYRPALWLRRVLERDGTVEALLRPAPTEEGGTFSWEPMEPGIYFVEDAGSGVKSEVATVTGKETTVEVRLDLADMVRVRGHVALHGRTGLGTTGLFVYPAESEGLATTHGPFDHALDERGAFDLWLPKRGRWRLQAYAFLLTDIDVASPLTGRAIPVTGPADDLVLDLE